MSQPAPPPLRQNPQQPIDQLQGTMNLLLTLLGEALKDPLKRRDPSQRLRVQQVFPSANLRFHDALDRMEGDIMSAQAILRRDLAVYRVAEKRKREEEVATKENVSKTDRAPVKEVEDVIMLENVMEDVKPKQEFYSKILEASTEATQATPALPTTTSEIAPASTATAAPPSKAVSAPEPVVPVASEQPKSPAASGSIAGMDDFTSIFGDELNPDPTGDENHHDMTSAFGDSGADVSSLLPGLETYANIQDDTGMPDVPQTSTEEDFGMMGLPPQESGTGLPQTVPEPEPDMNMDEFNVDFTQDLSGGLEGEGEDNTFAELFAIEDYEFGDAKTGQELDDWMNA